MQQRRTWQHDDIGTVVPLHAVSGGLQSIPGLMHICGAKAGSDVSSRSDLLIGTSFTLPGASKRALSKLSGSAGQQLTEAIKSVATQFELATTDGAMGQEAKQLVHKLQEMHCCIVAVDDNLDEHNVTSDNSAGMEECRQWLRQTQGYVLDLMKQVQACTTSTDISSTSSMDEAASTNSSTAGTAAGDTAWRVLCLDAAEVLSRAAEQMITGGAASSDYDSPRTLQTCAAPSSRLVAQQSRLSYSQYWSKKIAL